MPNTHVHQQYLIDINYQQVYLGLDNNHFLLFEYLIRIFVGLIYLSHIQLLQQYGQWCVDCIQSPLQPLR